MHDDLDLALKQHFSKREELPHAIRESLRKNYYAASAKKAAYPRAWLLAPLVILLALLVLVTINTLLGLWAIIVVITVYYLVTMVGGAIIITASLATKLEWRQ